MYDFTHCLMSPLKLLGRLHSSRHNIPAPALFFFFFFFFLSFSSFSYKKYTFIKHAYLSKGYFQGVFTKVYFSEMHILVGAGVGGPVGGGVHWAHTFYSTPFWGRVYKWKFCLSVHLSVCHHFLFFSFRL